MKRRLGIKNKLLICFGTIMVSGFLICGLISDTVCKNIITDKALENLTRLAQDTAHKISIVLTQKQLLIEKLAKADTITDESLSIEEKIKFLQRANQLLEFKDLALIDLQGNSYGTDGYRSNIAGSSEFEQAKQGKKGFSPSLILDDEVYFTIAVPVRNAEGKVISVIMGVETEEAFTYLIHKSGISDEIMVLDSEGEIIMHSNPDIFKDPVPMQDMLNRDEFKDVYELYQKMLSGESGAMECQSPETGIRNYLSYAPIDNIGWSIALATYRNSVLRGISDFNVILGTSIVIIIILGMIAVYFVANSLSKRMSEIIDYLDTVAQGDFEQPISEDLLELGDEVGDAARAIKTMKYEIEEMLETIKGCTNYVNEQMEDLTEDVKDEIKALLKADKIENENKEIIMNKLNDLQRATKYVELIDCKDDLFKS